ncbi:hypothetical protein IFM89_017624 [Coptis chinensis]|uniref:Biogenesis of lysosome-related organelles complex 1 subunit 7 n=1 Tax=Coptis chinensis TaxID=261450 RepID=A0A835GYM7_9MAGN|nr:hypothetical protein IFM89_017624 [Coptis chinensis]
MHGIKDSTNETQTTTQLQPENSSSSSSSNNNNEENKPFNTAPSSSSLNLLQPDLNLHTSDVLAKGVSSLLGSVMKDFDTKAENTLKSQDHLSFSIDRLTRELDQLLEDAPLPFIMQHAAKISGVRKRVSSLNSLLKSIQRRIDNVDRMISTGLSHVFRFNLELACQVSGNRHDKIFLSFKKMGRTSELEDLSSTSCQMLCCLIASEFKEKLHLEGATSVNLVISLLKELHPRSHDK